MCGHVYVCVYVNGDRYRCVHIYIYRERERYTHAYEAGATCGRARPGTRRSAPGRGGTCPGPFSCIYIYIYIYIHIYIYIYTYVYMCVYIYIYICICLLLYGFVVCLCVLIVLFVYVCLLFLFRLFCLLRHMPGACRRSETHGAPTDQGMPQAEDASQAHEEIPRKSESAILALRILSSCINVYIYIYIYTYKYVYMCIYVYIYIYVNILIPTWRGSTV